VKEREHSKRDKGKEVNRCWERGDTKLGRQSVSEVGERKVGK